MKNHHDACCQFGFRCKPIILLQRKRFNLNHSKDEFKWLSIEDRNLWMPQENLVSFSFFLLNQKRELLLTSNFFFTNLYHHRACSTHHFFFCIKSPLTKRKFHVGNRFLSTSRKSQE